MNITEHGKIVTVEMGKADLLYPVSVGALRKAMHKYAFAKGQTRPDDDNGERTGSKGEPWHEIEGACAENVVSAYLGIFWPGDWWTKKRTVDIPPDIEVRWTMYDSGHLIFYSTDKPDFRYVLVTGALPKFQLIGWYYGRDGKLESNRKVLNPDRPAQLAVTQNRLHRMEELRQSFGSDLAYPVNSNEAFDSGRT